MYCPKDFAPCADDLCRGANSCLYTKTALYERCPGRCGQLVSDDDHDMCECEPVYDEDDHEDDD